MHMLMQSASLIVTPLWTSICKPMNWLEVSRLTVFHTDLCKNFWGRTPILPPSIHLLPGLVLLTQCKSLYCIYNKQKNMHYTLILLYMYILPYITPLPPFFLLFTFWEKKIVPPPPPHFSSLSYAFGCGSIHVSKQKQNQAMKNDWVGLKLRSMVTSPHEYI